MKVLFLTHRLPYAPNRGDRARAYFLLKTLRATADVEVVSLVHDEEEASHAGELEALTGRVRTVRVSKWSGLVRSALALPSAMPITHTMLDAPTLAPTIEASVRERRPDVVLAYCSGMARLALVPPLRGIPFLLDMVDVDSAKWDALSLVAHVPLAWIYRREARVLRHFEATATRAAAVSTVVTTRERDTLRAIAPGSRVEVVPNGVDVEALRPPQGPAEAPGVVFCGVMNYAPNEQAAKFLAREIWPIVRQRRPDATLTLVGSSPTRAVLALADPMRGIVVTGGVPDVRPYLWGSAIAAAPIVTARGIQNKVLEAVAARLPTVVTPNILASLPQTVANACVAAEGAPALADAIIALLNLSPRERRAIAERAQVDELSWQQQLSPIDGLLRAAAEGRASQS